MLQLAKLIQSRRGRHIENQMRRRTAKPQARADHLHSGDQLRELSKTFNVGNTRQEPGIADAVDAFASTGCRIEAC
jgi:hypothetical protein